MLNPPPFPISALLSLAIQAGEKIMEHYQDDSLKIVRKEDNSPVTVADIAASDIIVAGLSQLIPEVPVVTEEGDAPLDFLHIDNQPDGRYSYNSLPFWLVDPLDGTKSFIRRTGEFTVNIAYLDKGTPLYGVVYLPVQKILYFTGEDGKAYRKAENGQTERISVRKPPANGLSVVASRSHLDPETQAFVDSLNVAEFTSASSSLKFCRVAEGVADIYPRFGPTMEWDTAAAHAVLLAAGGTVVKPDGSPFSYGKTQQEKPFLNGPFIAKGTF